jgi:hypothetical protein
VRALTVHPLEVAPAGLTLHAGVQPAEHADAPGWIAEFRLVGDTAGLKIPPPGAGGPADGLWRHTCFEAFVQDGAGPGYREFNFSPSGQWAVYRFHDERQRAPGDQPPAAGPAIEVNTAPGALHLRAWIPRSLWPDQPGPVGLSAVVETLDGRVSHWALHHPRAERPDFHHRGGWTLRPALPPSPTAARNP